MKKIIISLLCISILFISCSKNQTSDNPTENDNKTIEEIASEITIESSQQEIAAIKNDIMVDDLTIGSIKGNIIGDITTISIEVDEHYAEVQVYPFELRTTDDEKHYIYLSIDDKKNSYKKFDEIEFTSSGLTSIFLLGNDEIGIYVLVL